ncbi:hypothetical protein STCU_10336 [Strigomonas culicis]|uniref:Thioesterase domain-containing protein n=1 Tax=Strigomonas culicis TaxID=28005 RepID=S9TIH2_9TRYP|nr:hypothetical protein STCU_10336 [Strigomonas culicis]|eukprot:EPY17892.1 hypothetical protein STCU_10336 [Strigomonas culicis]
MFYIYYLFGRCRLYSYRASRARKQFITNLITGANVPAVLQESTAHVKQKSVNVTADLKKLSFLFFLQNAVSTTVRCNSDFAARGDHVNNSRYAEIIELGRCYHNTLLGLATIGGGTKKGDERLGLLVAGTSIEFVREIRHGAEVLVSSQVVAGETPESLTYVFSLWSKDGGLLHATSCVHVVLVGSTAYRERLERQYSGAEGAVQPAAGKHQWVKVRASYMLADVNGLTCVKEIKQMLVASRSHLTEGEHVLSRERFSDFGNPDLVVHQAISTEPMAPKEGPPPRDWIRSLAEAQRALRRHFRKVTF